VLLRGDLVLTAWPGGAAATPAAHAGARASSFRSGRCACASGAGAPVLVWTALLRRWVLSSRAEELTDRGRARAVEQLQDWRRAHVPGMQEARPCHASRGPASGQCDHEGTCFASRGMSVADCADTGLMIASRSAATLDAFELASARQARRKVALLALSK